MASIDTALYTRLGGFAGLTALVSTRIYPPPVPQNATYPCVSYSQVSGVRDYVMGNQSGLVQSRYQLDSWATTSTGARAVAEQVRLALSNYAGTSDTIVIDYVLMESETRIFEDESDLHRISQDFIVHYRETLPA